MDTLTGHHDSFSNNEILTPSESDMIKSKKSPQVIDGKTVADFLQGSCYKLSPEQFALVSNLDPVEVSDREFLQASKQFSDEDFVRAIYQAYFNHEPTTYDLKFWATEIKLHKSGRGRSCLLRALRKNISISRKAHKKKHSFLSKLLAPYFGRLGYCISQIFRKILGLQALEILSAVNLVIEQNESLLAGCLDRPKTGDKIKTSTYIIAGWLVGKDSQPVTIRLIGNKTVISEVPFTIPRPDVTKVYCLVSKTHNWGFNILLNVNQIPEDGDWELQASFADDKLVTIGLIKFRKY
jgi:hypothetical protein